MDLQSKIEIYEKAHKGIDDAFQVSDKEKKELGDQTEFTYGEVVFQSFVPLLEYADPRAGDVFYDLGCGSGKPMFIASLAFPELKVCKGIEYLHGLVALANQISDKFKAECEENNIQFSPIQAEQGDIL